jgi:hypothetical protein
MEQCRLSHFVITSTWYLLYFYDYMQIFSGFYGLGVSMLAFGTQVCGFKLGRSRRIFKGEKILSTPSFRVEVKLSVPCRRFAACKRSLELMWKSDSRPKFVRTFLAHEESHLPLPEVSHVVGREGTWRRRWERLNAGGKAVAAYP